MHLFNIYIWEHSEAQNSVRYNVNPANVFHIAILLRVEGNTDLKLKQYGLFTL